jgi:hypothetical protein
VGQINLLNPFSSRFDLTYSINDWQHHSKSDIDYAYLISQWLIKYHISDKIAVYGAYLFNHKHNASNDGYYTGVSYGSSPRAKEWSLDVNYQHVKVLAVPAFDTSSFGSGIQCKALYGITDAFSIQGKISTRKTAELSAIYKW